MIDASGHAGASAPAEHPSPTATPSPAGRSFRLVLLTTFATFCTLYVPQSLLPLLGERFGASPTVTALLITLVFVPLAIAPLLYGAVLRQASAQRLLVGSTLLLGALQLLAAAAPAFGWLLAARAAQGLLFPAILTAAVTYCSGAGDARTTSRRVSTYVATTILGGLGGRLIGGFGGEAIGWRATFALLGLALIGCGLALRLAARDARLPATRSNLAASREILATREFAAGFALIVVVFFVFTGFLNTLPFRLVALEPGMPAWRISLVYLGYLAGVAAALNVERLARRAGGPVRVMGIALGVFSLGVGATWAAGPAMLVAIGFLTSGGLFAVHATLSGYLNALRPDEASVVNGLYIALYYAAGALGSVLPLALYQAAGWSTFVAAMLAICALGTWPLRTLSAAREAATRFP